MNVTIFLHDMGGADNLGSLYAVLQERKASCRFVDCFDNELDQGFDAIAPDLLIVMGGSPGAYQGDLYPFLKKEMAVIEKRLARDLPVLGVCLGAQLMAAALGARNYKGEKPERWWQDIVVNEAGLKTPLRHLDAAQTKMMQWHQDTFDLPAGAALLASSAPYENQAFSYGRNALGFQCHPEMTPRLIRGWLADSADEAGNAELDLVALNKETDKYGPTLVAQTQKFFREWLDLIKER